MPMSDTAEMLQAILGAIDEGIHVVDANGITIYYNHVAARLDGLTPDEVLGKPLLEVFPSLDRHSSTLLRVIESGESIYNLPQVYTNWKGVRVETINTTLPVRVGKRLVGAVEVSKDIRKLKELSERLVDLQAQISKSRRSKRTGDAVSFSFDDILTCNERMKQLKERARRAARTTSPVLVYGETGTGKELFVQSIHHASARGDKPFIAQNCAAMPASLLESLLFGTTKGSFTGADDRPGLFELADGGTLFLDELNSMPMDLQAKLLRVLQDGQIRRIGGKQTTRVDVRIIAAVNEEPRSLVERKLLRHDLYYRINVVSLELPPLRHRREDIPLLTDHFIRMFNRRFGMSVRGVSPEVARLFAEYDWPGNVRELEHVVEAAMNMVEGEQIEREHLPQYLGERKGGGMPSGQGVDMSHAACWTAGERPLPEMMREIEEKIITEAMKQTEGNVLRAAKLLGIPRQTLQYKLSQMQKAKQDGKEGC